MRSIEMSLSVNVVGQKHKKKKKPEVFNFSAIHLIHDPQGELTDSLVFSYLFPSKMLTHKSIPFH